MHEHWNFWHAAVVFLSTATGQRILTSIVESMPPLPPNANWWEKWLYACAHLIANPNSNGGPK